MRVTFLGHSGFFLELDRVCLLFDYESGPLPPPIPGKGLLAFASHSHRDHFNRDIFAYGNRWKAADFLLGRDIRFSAKYRERLGVREESYHRLGSDQTACFQGVCIRTLDSTDAGVAFLVRAEGHTLFHAGDLNDWSWPEESEAERLDMETRFRREIDKLADIPIDLAFLPLDGRLGPEGTKGFDYVLTHCDVRLAVPMHSFGDYSAQQAFLQDPRSLPYRDRLRLMTVPGQALDWPTGE